ncbi:hypothetical protein Pat9b_1020 [Pantoea sp. At-9b]|nr:hypothetical protein Pat9b_1020 [Pantoea sp. At-9b]
MEYMNTALRETYGLEGRCSRVVVNHQSQNHTGVILADGQNAHYKPFDVV